MYFFWFFRLIGSCPKLKILETPYATLYACDIQDFVNVNKGRDFMLRFVIGLDYSAFDQIEELEAANYDIEIMGKCL